ncbi:AP-1 complex subunit gamma-1-like isoform X2 [Anopheles stephensi]|uniref:AP-1 complex subunit gamma-1-like isoform X2 n=1 Tax=Anopheles stephensi TaxID=30069 RepID=UPI00165884D1|nr:AP-1 complex subunit gamma-1-like isoform X2 [Anopheles stephensi]XP_035895163.1 AP-1 complex subunit gamma-1-like isoform X2 [Anopheles stephensi]XP_035895164.1 AP-1 complex subunit gamma-1-like isoform X2 [Anopheles stephensi]XP_035895165.1 AP-1 complex subunit gamma-1-like isoform X2 [Anopheles stephensi]XP_035895166.1 AP-1 complex subunit gamma-1-like isoform X2 [Anopheles stephensi]XP_035895167.1 AP-1 complex subunit gamma-1-like isoform X2 [Anopheles stephensi]XP_035895168.1 AP-1 com
MYPYYETDWSILPPEHNRRYSPGLTINNIKQVINETIETNILRKPAPTRLRELIRQIRACRTAAEERAVVNTECAYIRSTFRETDCIWKCRNMAKLLYIHMLGYPAHFGQVECLKLAASSKYTDKRIGYLGAMLLLDERTDVHVLLTNCLKNDLNSSTQFVVGTALCTLAAIASPEMARDLCNDVERLIVSTNAFLRKKAILCAFRFVRRVPELMEDYLPKCEVFLADKNHGILIATITLITEMCEQSLPVLRYFKSIIPTLVRMLKSLTVTGYSPEHLVSGVSDPFLQVKILRLLRVLGHGDSTQSEIMNDVLAQVATSTETSKNAGNAILYETVLTIMNVESENSLRVLAVNILGRFLLNNDKNIRFIGLLTLVKTVHKDMTAVQRHRITILECLSDGDPSIQRCAMELSFTLINTQNIEMVVRELLRYLESTDAEMKALCSSKIVLAAETYSPSIRWHLDVLLKILTIAGNNIRDDVISSTIQLISNSPQHEQRFITDKMWEAIMNMNQLENRQPLVQVAVWTIGEYGESGGFDEFELIEHYRQLLWAPQLSITTKQYILVSLAKISVRIDGCTPEIQNIINSFRVHMNIDLQQRANEFSQLFTNYKHLRNSLLEKMPKLKLTELTTSEYNADFASPESTEVEEQQEDPEAEQEPSNQDILLDLLGDCFSSDGNGNNALAVVPVSQPAAATTQPYYPTPTTSFNQAGLSSYNNNVPMAGTTDSIMDLLGLAAAAAGTAPTAPNQTHQTIAYATSGTAASIPSIDVYHKDDIFIRFFIHPTVDEQQPSSTASARITVQTTNGSQATIEKFLFQAAVPKSFVLTLREPSSTVMPPGGTIMQDLLIARQTSPSHAGPGLRMKVRFSYEVENYSMMEQIDVNDFPSGFLR